MGENGPKKSKSCQIYLEMSTPVNLEALSTSLTLIFQEYLKSIFRQISDNFKTFRDLLKNLHLINLEHVECGHLTRFYPKPKFGQIGLKTEISSDMFEILFTSQYLKVLTTNLTSLF